jgi:hypothetical protein
VSSLLIVNDEDTYMEEMAKLHKLNPKLDVIEVLLREFQKLQSDSSYKSELPGERRDGSRNGLC